MSEWESIELKELTTKIGSGATPRGGQEAYKSEGISLIRSQNILDFSFSYNGLAFIDEDQAYALRNVEVQENDILINITGDSVARVTKVPTEVLPARVNQHVSILRSNQNKLDPDYLLYYLLNPIIKKHLLSIASDGATRNALTKSDLEDLIIQAPKDVDDQKEIAKTINVYDQKITLLREQNQTLEELAQTLFKRWFVEFEFPCLPQDYHPSGQVNRSDIAKVCTYKSIGGLPAPDGASWFIYVLLCEDGSFYKGMTNDLYRRFYEHFIGEGAKHTKTHKPIKVIHWEQFDSQGKARMREEELKTGYGRTWLQRQWAKAQGGLPAPECQLRMAGKMEESELGEIPEGWELHPLEDLVKVHNGYSYKGSELQESNVAMVTLKNFDRNGGFRFDGFKELVSDRYKEKHIVDVGDLIVAHTDLTQDAEVLGNPALIMKNEKYTKLIVSMDLVKVESKHKSLNTEFLYYLMRDKRFKYHCKGYANGTTVLHLSKSAIPEYLFPFPKDMTLIEDFGAYAYSVYQKISNNIEEIQSLTQLRDTLLPKLMSGELRVKE